MHKIIGIGETILDILFRNGQPIAAVPGGSSFNSIISIGRAGVPCSFVGYTGQDVVGEQTIGFLKENGVSAQFFEVRSNEKSAISLAFLNEQGDANYVFYKTPPCAGEKWNLPEMKANDVLLYGSYYAACTGMRPLIEQALAKANVSGSIIYYDLNFRRSHLHELESLMPAIKSNFKASTVVRGSADDFEVMFGLRDAQEIYNRHIGAYCPIFICTAGAEQVTVCTPNDTYSFEVPPVEEVTSTVGAGDNFNAGFACALVWNGIKANELPTMKRDQWKRLITTACAFAREACTNTDNYISKEFGVRVSHRAD